MDTRIVQEWKGSLTTINDLFLHHTFFINIANNYKSVVVQNTKDANY